MAPTCGTSAVFSSGGGGRRGPPKGGKRRTRHSAAAAAAGLDPGGRRRAARTFAELLEEVRAAPPRPSDSHLAVCQWTPIWRAPLLLRRVRIHCAIHLRALRGALLLPALPLRSRGHPLPQVRGVMPPLPLPAPMPPPSRPISSK
eukprot:SM000105S13886  [mRNA]  locus=s105:243298:243880:- [translate_table: standard]